MHLRAKISLEGVSTIGPHRKLIHINAKLSLGSMSKLQAAIEHIVIELEFCFQLSKSFNSTILQDMAHGGDPQPISKL